ncbi:hypothetical protein J5N97_024920 [Dioscorea zingiberensis]|uniref:Gluconokinase n=1 Tax=Dioscorea zingiberensis TaxID=325984 RepID=A0A9D5C806_9LILI|nr:hypothetical protein J5N97_024920 [Dioscorea zingiberensis]
MASDLQAQGLAIVIMGVSGSGKSTVCKMLAKTLGCNFIEADDYHSQSNKDKMSRGIPLSDEDRIPWLETLSSTIRNYLINGDTVTLTCSALRQQYREILRSADPNYKPGNYSHCRVQFVCLVAPAEVIAERIKIRSNEEKHFMPAKLLQSQLDLLQIDEAEQISKIDATSGLQNIVNSIILLINNKYKCGNENLLPVSFPGSGLSLL